MTRALYRPRPTWRPLIIRNRPSRAYPGDGRTVPVLYAFGVLPIVRGWPS